MEKLIIDCGTCAVAGPACGDCVISALLGVPDASGPPALDLEEQRVLGLLAASGMLPPLRLVQSAVARRTAEPESFPERISQKRWG